MKHTKWLMLAGMAVLLMTMGCEKQMGLVEPTAGDVNVAATDLWMHQYGTNWFYYFHYKAPDLATFPLCIGQDDGNNGQVDVWKDGDHLYVKYYTYGGWFIAQTHVAVAVDKDGIPHNKSGNMTPGKFEFGDNYYPYVTEAEVDCGWDDDWNDPPYYDSLFIVAHCIVGKEIAPGETIWQTGTGGERQYKNPALPDFCVWMDVDRQGFPRCYYWVDLSWTQSDPEPWDPYIWPGEWPAWCADQDRGIGPDDAFYVCLFSMFDQDKSGFPNYFPFTDPDWPKIGWLLNHWQEYTDPVITSTGVQNVIYYFLGQKTYGELTEIEKVAANDADLHGAWKPSEGEVVPVFMIPCDPAFNNKQPLFIEVDP